MSEALPAKITSAVALSESQKAAVEEIIQRKLKTAVLASHAVDRTLIGGFCIYVDGILIDHSLRYKLQETAKMLQARETPS